MGLVLACALFQAGIGQAALAESTDPLSPAPTIDRDRVDRQDAAIPAAPRPAEAPRAQAVKPPVVEAPGASNITLVRLRYEGATLPRSVLDAAAAPFIGQPLTRETLQKIVNAINAVYIDSNVAFYSVGIPRQTVTGGELLVQVTEGRISQYALREQTRSTPTGLIAAHMDRLMRDRPTQKSQLERTLSLLRDIPGQTVDAQLETTAVPGELALDLGVKRKQVDIALNINNNGVTNVVSGVQAQLSVGIHGLLREGDSTRATGYLPFRSNRYQFYSLSHSTPIGSNGTTLALSGAYVRTLTKDTDLRGEAKQAGISISHPVIRSYRRNLSVGLSLDGINSENYFLDTAFGGFRTRVVRASTSWSSIGKKGGYAVSGIFSHGIDGLGARAFNGFSQASFAKANLQVTAVTELGKDFALKVTARGQYSADKLPTTERFSLGGDGAGLAYRLGVLSAESAAAGSAEISWKVKGVKTGAGGGLTIFAYVDGALAHTVARPVYKLPAKDYSLASAGGGARVIAFGGWTASVQVAVPVKKPIGEFGRKTRFFFSISRAV